jgi:hypothetical protein
MILVRYEAVEAGVTDHLPLLGSDVAVNEVAVPEAKYSFSS